MMTGILGNRLKREKTMKNKHKYIEVIQTADYYQGEIKFHQDAIKDIEELLIDLHISNGTSQCYDVGGVMVSEVDVAIEDINNNPYNHEDE